jgi:hypothetical protein
MVEREQECTSKNRLTKEHQRLMGEDRVGVEVLAKISGCAQKD